MKNIKSVLAVIVVVCLMMCLAVPAFATAETVVETTAATTAETTAETTEATAEATTDETTAEAAETTAAAETTEETVLADVEATEPPHLDETDSTDAVIEFDDLQDAAGVEDGHDHTHEGEEVGFKKVARIVLTVLEVITSVALVAVVLLQSGKESGLSGALSGNSDSYMNKNGSGSLDKKLAKATKWVALAWILLTLALFLL